MCSPVVLKSFKNKFNFKHQSGLKNIFKWCGSPDFHVICSAFEGGVKPWNYSLSLFCLSFFLIKPSALKYSGSLEDIGRLHVGNVCFYSVQSHVAYCCKQKEQATLIFAFALSESASRHPYTSPEFCITVFSLRCINCQRMLLKVPGCCGELRGLLLWQPAARFGVLPVFQHIFQWRDEGRHRRRKTEVRQRLLPLPLSFCAQPCLLLICCVWQT